MPPLPPPRPRPNRPPCRPRSDRFPFQPMSSFGLIIIGDEILSGKRQDKHMTQVIQLLQARGLSLAWCQLVGDDRQRITAALAQAFQSGDTVFSCGGIGATPDDHTRQCAGAALGRELELHPQARDLIESRMRDIAAEQGVPFDINALKPENLEELVEHLNDLTVDVDQERTKVRIFCE